MATGDILKQILKELKEIKSDYKEFKGLQEKQGMEFRAIFDELKKENSALKKTVTNLVVKNNKLETEVSLLKTGLNTLLQDKLANNLIISGVPVTENENLSKLVVEIGSELKVDISGSKFNVRRLFTKTPNKYANLLVEFEDIKYKTELLKQKKHHPLLVSQLGFKTETERQIFFFHQLTASYLNVLSEARKLKESHHFRYIWYQNNQVLIKKENNQKVYAVKSLNDLTNLAKSIESEKTDLFVDAQEVIDVDAPGTSKSRIKNK